MSFTKSPRPIAATGKLSPGTPPPYSWLLLHLILFCLLGNNALNAADKTWNGASSLNANWSSGPIPIVDPSGNWTGAASPVTGDSLFFGGTARLNNTNDILNAVLSSVGGITFNNGAGEF